MVDIEAWLDSALAPLSRIGARLGRAPVFAPGEEAPAQKTMDFLLDRTQWDDIAVEVARTSLPQIPDIAQSLTAAQAGSVDLVDLAQINVFLERFFLLYPTWHEVLVRAGSWVLDATLYRMLLEVHTSVRIGQTPEGYALHDGIDMQLAVLRQDLRAVQNELAVWSATLATELQACGLAAANAVEFLIANASRDLLERPDITGHVRIIRETPDFVVCTLRYDDTARAFLAREQVLERELEAVETTLLETLGDQISERSIALEAACEWIAALDVLLARRAFVVRHDLQRARIRSERCFVCEDAAYLPLRDRLGKRYTPVSLSCDSLAVLSGANMGGKTSALQAAALLVACVRRGLPVAARYAETALFDRIIWLGEHRELPDTGLSSFGREMISVRRALEISAERCFVLLDEVARTTTPREGRALLIATLRGFAERGATALAATHLDDVAERCGAIHYRLIGLNAEFFGAEHASAGQLLRSLEDAFDRRFVRVVSDTAGRDSQAFDVARALGVPDDILQHAHEEFLYR